MNWLNYHHLLYFWRVAALGSVSAAAQELRLRQPTISAQIAQLEAALGRKLFVRDGRRLIMTEEGQIALRYAEEIFSSGRELMDVMNDRPVGRPMQCVVGVADVVPKLIAFKLLEPALKLKEAVHLECHEDKPSALLALLATHKLDLVISDSPIPTDINVRGFNHLMGESRIAFFAKPKVARRLSSGFPRSLEGQPMLLPFPATTLRRSVDQWLESANIRAHIIGEFDDSALLKIFGERGYGVFPAPLAIAKDIERDHRVKLLAIIPGFVERYYAISPARRIRHPVIDELVAGGKKFLGHQIQLRRQGN